MDHTQRQKKLKTDTLKTGEKETTSRQKGKEKKKEEDPNKSDRGKNLWLRQRSKVEFYESEEESDQDVLDTFIYNFLEDQDFSVAGRTIYPHDLNSLVYQKEKEKGDFCT